MNSRSQHKEVRCNASSNLFHCSVQSGHQNKTKKNDGGNGTLTGFSRWPKRMVDYVFL